MYIYQYFKYVFMVYLWCIYGVSGIHHSCGAANSWFRGYSHRSEKSI